MVKTMERESNGSIIVFTQEFQDARILCISSILQKEVNITGTDERYKVQGFSRIDRNMMTDMV